MCELSNDFGPDFTTICYEQIENNYYYGLFGNFKIIIDKSTGYFNASRLCKDGGRNFKNWKRNKNTVELIDYYSKKPGAHIRASEILYLISGGNNLIIRGSYVFSELILNIACWISPDFYNKVYTIVSDYFINDFQQFQKDNHLLYLRNQEIQIQMHNIKTRNLELEQKYENIKEDVSPKLRTVNKLHMFSIIKKNSDHDEKFPYYVIRGQRLNYDKSMDKTIRRRYSKYKEILRINYNPNSINLFNKIKEEIHFIKYSHNHLKINAAYSEKDLKTRIYELIERK